jgi:hypothetical protein
MIIGDFGCGVYSFKHSLTGAPTTPFNAAHIPPEADSEDESVQLRLQGLLCDHKRDMWAFGVCLHMLAFKQYRDVHQQETVDFYRTLSKDEKTKSQIGIELIQKYKSAQDGISGPALRSCHVLATVLAHTLWPKPGMRWSAQQVLAALEIPEPEKVGTRFCMGRVLLEGSRRPLVAGAGCFELAAVHATCNQGRGEGGVASRL